MPMCVNSCLDFFFFRKPLFVEMLGRDTLHMPADEVADQRSALSFVQGMKPRLGGAQASLYRKHRCYCKFALASRACVKDQCCSLHSV